MDKRISETVTYKLPIADFDCTKDFLSNLEEKSKKLNKNYMWKDFVEGWIKEGLEVVFIHVWDTDEQMFDGFHCKKEMVFKVYLGFSSVGHELYPVGLYGTESIDSLCKAYENNPDFVFEQLDWDAPKEEIIKDFLDDLLKGDFVE